MSSERSQNPLCLRHRQWVSIIRVHRCTISQTTFLGPSSMHDTPPYASRSPTISEQSFDDACVPFRALRNASFDMPSFGSVCTGVEAT